MKKLLYTFGIFAVAAIAFTACQKEQPKQDTLPSEKLVTVTFTAEKAGLATKTAAVESETSVSYIWTNEDIANMKLFTVGTKIEGDQEVEDLTVVANPIVTKVSDTQLTISGQVKPGKHTFRAMLSGTWTGHNRPRLNNSQNPSFEGFDPKADVLVSDDMEVEVVGSGEETVSTSDLLMTFRRLVVVNKMTLKNLTSGEKISKVIISSAKNLAGYYGDCKTASGDKKSITLNYNDIVVSETFPVYFTTIPETGHSLTVEVTTDQHIYTKSFAENKYVDFNLGQFTKFNLALPAGVANTALTIPLVDSMEWAQTGNSDETNALSTADLTAVQGGKKIYDSSSYAYKGADGLKLGSSNNRGSITTNDIDLSSPFCVAIDAKKYGSDVSQVIIQVDGSDNYILTSENLTDAYKTYYFYFDAATATSNVTISIAGKRGYIKNLAIETYIPDPVINVTTDNPMEVENTASSQTIEYSISHPTEASISANANVDWIHDFDYSTTGEVAFEVDAQASNAAPRSGVVTLSYTGADDVTITVNQAAGDQYTIPKGATWSYTFEAKVWNAAGNQTISGKTWTMAGEGGPYFDYDSNYGKGQQFGSGSKPYSELTLSSNFGEAYGIDAIQVSTSGASSINATVSVSVGGTSFKCGESTSVSLTASNTVYEFVSPDGNLKAGEIVISYDNGSSKAIYVKKIVVNPAPAQQLTMSDITCTSHTSSSLTFGWAEVSGASGYQVSTNGEDFGSTQQGLTYTLSNLEPETSYTIWVKAIGDGGSYTTSEPKQSAVGTTDAQGGDDTTDYSTIYTSGITLSTTGGTSASTCKVVISEKSYDGIKAGTGSVFGAVKITVPEGTTKLHLHVAAWNGETVSLAVTPTGYSSNISLTSDSGIKSNTPFTIDSPTKCSTDYYKVITFSQALSQNIQLTFTATGGKRFVVWGVNAEN